MKKLFAILALSGSFMLATACNTIHGATEDVESVGDCVDGRPGNC